MNWRGISIEATSDEPGCPIRIVEICDEARAADLVLCTEVIESAKLDPAVGLAVWYSQGAYRCEIRDEVELALWISNRLTADEEYELTEEYEDSAQGAADDSAETLMRDRAAGVA